MSYFSWYGGAEHHINIHQICCTLHHQIWINLYTYLYQIVILLVQNAIVGAKCSISRELNFPANDDLDIVRIKTYIKR